MKLFLHASIFLLLSCAVRAEDSRTWDTYYPQWQGPRYDAGHRYSYGRDGLYHHSDGVYVTGGVIVDVPVPWHGPNTVRHFTSSLYDRVGRIDNHFGELVYSDTSSDIQSCYGIGVVVDGDGSINVLVAKEVITDTLNGDVVLTTNLYLLKKPLGGAWATTLVEVFTGGFLSAVPSAPGDGATVTHCDGFINNVASSRAPDGTTSVYCVKRYSIYKYYTSTSRWELDDTYGEIWHWAEGGVQEIVGDLHLETTALFVQIVADADQCIILGQAHPTSAGPLTMWHSSAGGEPAALKENPGLWHIDSFFVNPGAEYHLNWLQNSGGTMIGYYRMEGGSEVSFGAALGSGVFKDANGTLHRLVGRATTTEHSRWVGSAWETATSLPYVASDWNAEPETGRLFGIGKSSTEMNLGMQDSMSMVSGPANCVVNATNGNLFVPLGLFSTAGHGPTASVSLFYNSMDVNAGVCGRNWRHSYMVSLNDNVLQLPDGRMIRFEYDSGLGFWVPEEEYGVSLKLTLIELGTHDNWQIETVEGWKWTFNEDGRLLSITDQNNLAMTLAYDPVGPAQDRREVLVAITDYYGGVTSFEYDANDRLLRVIEPGGLSYELAIDSATGVLESVTAKKGSNTQWQWQFKYWNASGTGIYGGSPDIPAECLPLVGIPYALARIQNSVMQDVASAGNDVWVGYHKGSNYGRVKILWEPMIAPAISTGAATRKAQQFAYDITVTAGTTLFKTVYTEQSGLIYNLFCDYQRGLAPRVEDPVNGAAKPTLRVFDSRRNVLQFTDTANRTLIQEIAGVADGLPGWVRDLPKSYELPGDVGSGGVHLKTLIHYSSTARKPDLITPVTGSGEAIVYEYEGFNLTSMKLPLDALPYVTERDAEGKVTRQEDPLHRGVTIEHVGQPTGLPSKIQVDGVVDSAGTPKGVTPNFLPNGKLNDITNEYGGKYEVGRAPNDLPNATKQPDTGEGVQPDEYLYAPLGTLTKVKDANGNATEYFYDALGRLTKIKNAALKESKLEYTSTGKLSIVQGFRGERTYYEYDALDRLTKTKVDVTSSQQLISTMEYDAEGSLTKTTVAGSDGNPPARSTTFVYDPAGTPADQKKGLLTKTILPGGDTEIRYVYDAKRRVVAQETWWADGAAPSFYRGTAYVFDANGRVTKSVIEDAPYPTSTGIPTGRATSLEYDASGNLTKRISPMGRVTEFEYDTANRQTLKRDATGVETLTLYSEGSSVTGIGMRIPGKAGEDIPGHSGFLVPNRTVYDSRGRPAVLLNNMHPSDITTLHYYGGNQPKDTIGPLGLYSAAEYDNLNQLTRSILRKEGSLNLCYDTRYDDSGNPTDKYAPPGYGSIYKWHYEHNLAGRQTSAISPRGFTSTTESDALGNVTSSLDEDLNASGFAYDFQNRLTGATYTHGATTENIEYEYDGTGALLSVEGLDSHYRVEYKYKPDSGIDPHTGELRKVTWFLSGVIWKTITYEYDNDGRRTNTTVIDGAVSRVQDMEYDAAGRLTKIEHDGAMQATFEYQHGFLTKTTLGNGNTIKRRYDKRGRLEQLSHRAGAVLLSSIVYQYDERDRRKNAYYSHLDVLSTFEYNKASWLVEEHHESGGGGPTWTNQEAANYGGNESAATAPVAATPAASAASVHINYTYDYDDRGNRITKHVVGSPTQICTYAYDEEDRLTDESRAGKTITYEYEERGSLTKKIDDGAITNYYTDYLGRITAFSAGLISWSYKYAPTGDRVGKTDLTLTTSNEWYLPSDGDTIADYTKPTGEPETFTGMYVSPGIDGRVARIGADGPTTPHYYFGDALQSVHQVTDASGALIGTNFSDAWGNKLAIGMSPPTGPGSRYSFQGREDDNESGLMHFRARSYDPMTGRFTSRDPVPFSNLYLFVQNNPVNMTDPSGQLPDRAELAVLSQPALVQRATDYEAARARAASSGKADYIVQDLADSAAMAREVLISRKQLDTTVVGVGEFCETLFSTKSLWHLGFAAQGFARQAEDTLKGVAEGAPEVVDSLSGLTDTTGADLAEVVLPGLEQRAEALTSTDPATVADAVGRSTYDLEQAAVMQYGPRAIGSSSILKIKLTISEPIPAAPAPPRPIPTITFGDGMPNIAANTAEALARGAPDIVHRAPSNIIDLTRRLSLKGKAPAPAGFSWEEFPPASTIEGGVAARPFTRLVPVGEQNLQGALLKNFYDRFGIKPGDAFRVQANPPPAGGR